MRRDFETETNIEKHLILGGIECAQQDRRVLDSSPGPGI